MFGTEVPESVFTKHMMHFKRKGLTRADMVKLIDTGINMILGDNFSDNPHNDKVMDMVKASQNIHSS